MTLEDRCKQTFGDLTWTIHVLSQQLEDANNKIMELKNENKSDRPTTD